MLNKNNILRFLIVVLLFSSIAIATETTWRHSGFEISGFDINGSSTYNITEIRKIEFGWNSTIPAVSETSRAVMYYDDNQKRIMQSLNGGAYQAIVDNTTVNAYTVNASNATGVLPNASIPLSAANISAANVFGAYNQTFDTNTLFVDAINDRVGIRTTTPRTTLQIGDLSSGTGESTYPGDLILQRQSLSSINTTGGGIEFKQDASGSGYGWKMTPLSDGLASFVVGNRVNVATWTERLLIDGVNGNVGIGNTTPGYDLTVGTSPWSGMNAGDSAFTTSSSRELKDNITEINISNSWQRISLLKPSTFKWRGATTSNMSSNNSNNTIWGLIADETKVAYPDTEDGKVEWNKILTDLVGAEKFSILKIKLLDSQKLDKVGDSANMENLIVQNKFVVPKYSYLPDTYPNGGLAYNTTDKTVNVMNPDGWYIVQTTKR